MIFSFAKHKKNNSIFMAFIWIKLLLLLYLLIIIILQKMLCKYQISNLNCFGKNENYIISLN